MMVVGYIKTKNYKPNLAERWNDTVVVLQDEVVFGKITSPVFGLLSIMVVAVILGFIIVTSKMGDGSLKNTKLRIAWIIPNVFCYLMFIGALIFVVSNAEGIKEIGQAPYWALMLLALFGVSFFGSLRIWRWISEGKM